MSERTNAGTFAPGNKGGPGRPARIVEADHLRALSDRLTPERWAAIVDRAISDAETGDAKARDWVARFALGSQPPTLWRLALADHAGVSVADELAAAAQLATEREDLYKFDGPDANEQTIKLGASSRVG